MLLDLVTKQVDNEEMHEEQDDKDMRAGKKLGNMAAMQVDVLSAAVTDELSTSTLSDASSISISAYETVTPFLTEEHPNINLTTSRHVAEQDQKGVFSGGWNFEKKTLLNLRPDLPHS